jgi:SAM-dependent methyltransferase
MNTEAIEQQRREIYEVAEAIAPTWERRRAYVEAVSTPVREWMLRELGPRAGDTVLELAAGVGNVEYRVMDAERIELEANSVDGVLCRFGYMLMADPAKALAETRRVLRPGGRLALAVWGAMERSPFFTIVAISLFEHGHLPPPEPPGPPVFSMASADHTKALLEGAGFADVRTEEVPVRFEFPDTDEYLSVISDTAGPLGLALRELSETDREAVKAHVDDSLARFTAERGYELPGAVLCAAAG